MMTPKIFSSFVFKMSLVLGIMGIAFICSPAWAQSAFQSAYKALYETFTQVRVIVYVLSAFGLIGFAVAAIMGKFDFVWLSMIAVALFFLSAAELVVKTAVEYGGGTYSLPEGQTMEASLAEVESALGYEDTETQQAIDSLRDNSS